MSGMTAGTIQQAKVELNCDMQSLIPALCQDVYHYMDLIDAVRNPTFNLPMMMPYGRFRFLLEQLAEKQHCQTFLSLDPKLPLSPGNRRMLCLSGDSSLLEELSGRLILTLDMSTDDILALRVRDPGVKNCKFADEHIMFPILPGTQFSITYRSIRVSHLHTEAHREWLLRLRASESGMLSRSALMLVTDLSMPISIIPGLETRRKLESICHAEDLVPLPSVPPYLDMSFSNQVAAASGYSDQYHNNPFLRP
jgi:hypothetical protein